jgi:hypothetical protein
MSVKVIVEIDPSTGKVSYEVEGAEGTKCTDITNALTSGKKLLKQELKQEFGERSECPDYVND